MTEEAPENDSEASHNVSAHIGPHYEGHQDHSTQQDGDGNIHIGGNSYGGIHQYTTSLALPEKAARSMFRRPAPPQPVNEESLRQLHDRFVAPDRYDTAKQVFETRSAVVVTGAPGSGRRSAAMKLLFDTTATRHELFSDSDEEDFQWDPDAVGPGEGLLLDLSERSPEHVRSVLERSEQFRAQVAAKRCKVALVVPRQTEHLLGGDLARQVVSIGRPDSRSVLGRHLTAERIEYTDSDLDFPSLQPHLRSERMAELARLSRLIRDVQFSNETSEFSECLEQALLAFTHRDKQVRDWLSRYAGGDERALILSAALLDGAPTDAVHAATGELLKTVRFPGDSRHVLERDGITRQLHALEIGVDDNRRVRFQSLDFDHEVRTYFWAEYPGLRGKFREWLGRTAQLSMIDDRSRNTMAVHFAEQCLMTGRPGDILSLGQQWVKGPRGSSTAVLESVELILQAGLLDERFGSWFRKQVYEWATRPKSVELPRKFDELLIKLCTGSIAQSHPGQALVRLHHFARRGDVVIARRAAAEIVGLAGDRFFFRRTLHRLVDEKTSKRDSRDMDLFLRLTIPHRLLSESARSQALLFDRDVRRQLLTGWRAVLAQPTSVWERFGRDWLQAASEQQRHLALLDVLVDACDGSTPPLSRLHGLALRWTRDAHGAERTRRARTTSELNRRIDAAQGLTFLTDSGAGTR